MRSPVAACNICNALDHICADKNQVDRCIPAGAPAVQGPRKAAMALNGGTKQMALRWPCPIKDLHLEGMGDLHLEIPQSLV